MCLVRSATFGLLCWIFVERMEVVAGYIICLIQQLNRHPTYGEFLSQIGARAKLSRVHGQNQSLNFQGVRKGSHLSVFSCLL